MEETDATSEDEIHFERFRSYMWVPQLSSAVSDMISDLDSFNIRSSNEHQYPIENIESKKWKGLTLVGTDVL